MSSATTVRAAVLSIIWIMPAMQDFVSFALLVIVLIVMPGGMVGLLAKLKKP